MNPVHLFCQVKVREKWLEDAQRYSEMGLNFKDGNIDFHEFTKLLKQRARKNKFLKSFQLLDKNGDGKISKDEIKAVIKQCGGTFFDEEVEKVIQNVDKDGDGYLNYNEFLNIMMK